MATDVRNQPSKLTYDPKRNTVKIERPNEVFWLTRKGSDYSWKSNLRKKGGLGNIRELHDQIEYTEEEWAFFDVHI